MLQFFRNSKTQFSPSLIHQNIFVYHFQMFWMIRWVTCNMTPTCCIATIHNFILKKLGENCPSLISGIHYLYIHLWSNCVACCLFLMDAPEDIGHMREYRDPWEDERISWDKQMFLLQNKSITSLIFRYRASCETAVRPPNISLVQNISWSWYSIITKITGVEMREATLPCSVNRGRERESVGTDLTKCSVFGTGRK